MAIDWSNRSGHEPTEYLFFYYSQRKAYRNQLSAGAGRGEELQRMNSVLFERLGAQTDSEALATYTSYLQQRAALQSSLQRAARPQRKEVSHA